MIILAPRQQLSDPPAAKGPLWSKRTPILMVCACASARSREAAAAPSAPTRSRTKTTRNHFMPKPPLAMTGEPAIEAGWKKVPNRSTRSLLESTRAPAREDQPFETAAALGGGGGGHRLQKIEARSEVGLDALARDGK